MTPRELFDAMMQCDVVYINDAVSGHAKCWISSVGTTHTIVETVCGTIIKEVNNN